MPVPRGFPTRFLVANCLASNATSNHFNFLFTSRKYPISSVSDMSIDLFLYPIFHFSSICRSCAGVAREYIICQGIRIKKRIRISAGSLHLQFSPA